MTKTSAYELGGNIQLSTYQYFSPKYSLKYEHSHVTNKLPFYFLTRLIKCIQLKEKGPADLMCVYVQA